MKSLSCSRGRTEKKMKESGDQSQGNIINQLKEG